MALNTYLIITLHTLCCWSIETRKQQCTTKISHYSLSLSQLYSRKFDGNQNSPLACHVRFCIRVALLNSSHAFLLLSCVMGFCWVEGCLNWCVGVMGCPFWLGHDMMSILLRFDLERGKNYESFLACYAQSLWVGSMNHVLYFLPPTPLRAPFVWKSWPCFGTSS